MKWLIDKRRHSGLSQARLAEKAEISQSFLAEIERGKKRPSVPVAKKIAAVLGFDWTRFYE